MENGNLGDKETTPSGRPEGKEPQPKEGKIDKRPLFDESAGGDQLLQEEIKKEKIPVQKNLGEEPSEINEVSTEEHEPTESVGQASPRRIFLKWMVIGGGGFVVVLMAAFFFASLYLHKKEAMLTGGKSRRVAIQPIVKKEKRVVIKQYTLQPFFLRLKNVQTGEDKFLSAQIYIEFVRKELPEEIQSKREILRTLIYKQLLKHFSDGKDSPQKEKKFKEELIPALNTFFHGGGVYDIGFKELVIR